MSTHEDRPLVALTTSYAGQAGSHRRPQIVLYSAYIRALEEAGLVSVLISPSHSTESIAALLSVCHGLVLTGGGDIEPARYGESARLELDSVSPERDAAEFTALGAALERDLPIFGICRGIQVMNVFLGGSLYQDIDQDRRGPQAAAHGQSRSWSERVHEVTVAEESKLRAIVGAPRLRINSFHHQAIRAVAPSLTVTALAEDGLIEAVEMRDCTWGLGVQWHPERQEAAATASDPDRRLFRAFAAAVAERRAGVRPLRVD